MNNTYPVSEEGGAPRNCPEPSFAEKLGIQDIPSPDELAPAVDRDNLRLFARRQMSSASAATIAGLLARYRPWRNALADILREEVTQPEQ
jgi:hypothetical protein